MARSEHTGIFQTYIPETLKELFHSYGANANLGTAYEEIEPVVAKIKVCERRAWQVLNGTGNDPAWTVIVKIDSSRRPLTEIQNRDENRKALEDICARDLRNDPRVIADPAFLAVLIEARDLLISADTFYRTWPLRELALKALCGDRHAVERAELVEDVRRLSLTLHDKAMEIATLAIKIAVRPFEKSARTGRKQLEANKESAAGRRRGAQKRKRVFLKYYRDSNGKTKRRRIDEAREAFTEAFRKENEEREESEKIKTPSARTVYDWLADKAK